MTSFGDTYMIEKADKHKSGGFFKKQKLLLKIKNIKQYYILTFLTNLLFGESSWLFFWALFLSYDKIGTIDALGFGFGLMLEIPTGAIADLIGKKKTIISSFIFTSIGIFTMASASGFSSMLIGLLLFQAGFALYSGTSEALAYDSLLEQGREDDYEAVISLTNIIMILSLVMATFIGGRFLFGINVRFPYIFWGVAQVIAIFVALTLKEPKVETIKFSFTNYISQLGIGVRSLFHPSLRKYIVSIFIVLGTFFIFDWGLLKPVMAVSFGMDAKMLAIVSPALYLVSAFAIYKLHFFRKFFGDGTGIIFLTLLIGIGLFLTAFDIGLWGIIPMLLISVAGNLGTPWLSIIINKKVNSKYRATVLSTVALITKIPYVLFSYALGISMDGGVLRDFALVVSLGVFASVFIPLILSMFTGKKNISGIGS